MDFARLFHFVSKTHRKTPPENEWPIEWKTVYYKTYERFAKIKLPKPDEEVLNKPYIEIPLKRKSKRVFGSEILNINDISTLLKYSCGIVRRDDTKVVRAHPSGGGRFPIEIYIILPYGATGLTSGLYHYNIKDHSLSLLYEKELSKTEILEIFTYPFTADAKALIVMTTVFQRMTAKYGQRGYRHILLEAGHIGQNFCNVATLLNLNICPLSGTRDVALENFLDIDGITESVVYALALGK